MVFVNVRLAFLNKNIKYEQIFVKNNCNCNRNSTCVLPPYLEVFVAENCTGKLGQFKLG